MSNLRERSSLLLKKEDSLSRTIKENTRLKSVRTGNLEEDASLVTSVVLLMVDMNSRLRY